MKQIEVDVSHLARVSSQTIVCLMIIVIGCISQESCDGRPRQFTMTKRTAFYR